MPYPSKKSFVSACLAIAFYAGMSSAYAQRLVAEPAPSTVSASGIDWRSGSGAALLKDLKPANSSEWKNHIYKRPDEGEYCSLSFGFAGELKSNGYKGVRLGTKTVDLKPGAAGN